MVSANCKRSPKPLATHPTVSRKPLTNYIKKLAESLVPKLSASANVVKGISKLQICWISCHKRKQGELRPPSHLRRKLKFIR
ncbi:hypothetical protein [Tumidithrix helvetica]|uniref:hypothetical protein n=1 Tax=Tumidithrix helvetica TaxID=3457545 RepID=UPI003CC668BC